MNDGLTWTSRADSSYWSPRTGHTVTVDLVKHLCCADDPTTYFRSQHLCGRLGKPKCRALQASAANNFVSTFVLVGGFDGSQYFDDVWTWLPYDGEWIKVSECSCWCFGFTLVNIAAHLNAHRISQLRSTFKQAPARLTAESQTPPLSITYLLTATYDEQCPCHSLFLALNNARRQSNFGWCSLLPLDHWNDSILGS